MMRKKHIILLMIIAGALALLAAGCGGGADTSETQTIPQACLEQPSLIPANAGKPQLIYYFNPG